MTMVSQPAGTLPVRTLERVPAETVQVWVQFAYMANTPAVFDVLADVFFALSWEVHAQEQLQHIEQAITSPYVDAPFWMGMYVHSADCAVRDWQSAAASLSRVVDGQGAVEFTGWRDFAHARKEQLAQSAEQMFQAALFTCEQMGAELPTDYLKERLARQLQSQLAPGQQQ